MHEATVEPNELLDNASLQFTVTQVLSGTTDTAGLAGFRPDEKAFSEKFTAKINIMM